jgi:hypothetical protein
MKEQLDIKVIPNYNPLTHNNTAGELQKKALQVAKDKGAVFHRFLHDRNDYSYVEYDSVFHFMETAEAMLADKDISDKRYTRYVSNPFHKNDEWSLGTEFNTIEKTREALTKGQPAQATIKGIEEMRKKLLENETVKKTMEKGRSLKRQRKFEMDGGELDIDRVMCGDPEYWMKLQLGKKNNIIRIGFNFSMNCGNGEKEFYRLAAVASVMSDLFQVCGYSVEIMAASFTSGGVHGNGAPNITGTIMPIKRADEPLDIMRVASIGIPGMLRKYGFAQYVTVHPGEPDYGLGQAQKSDEAFKQHFDINYTVGKGWCPDMNKSVLFVENIFKQLAGEADDVQIAEPVEF